ncbi:LysR family transcriptional regulator [Shewanella colwelliana]|uniref:LysR family transcriptional regulator n=1 Tax=Shewanella colwelliana TaxID=23 RepID=UPI00048C4DFB|nr:LysR family transcriptional regulator [Shewanella colwelliana]MDX1281361.1 LysR family transcriptional regulator [Shewanella colwelliana]GIU18649.1 LysR family transcriptional regulator [Shewanella colwelliana]
MDASQLYRMLVFASVVEQGSLTAAAETLGISRSMVSQHLKRLENRCQLSLLHRTTRKISLTQEGQQFYHYCAELLKLAKQAEAAIIPNDEQLQGSIKIAAPVAIGELALAALLKEFHKRYPKIHVSLQLEDRKLDQLEHHIDIAIQTGQPDNEELVAIKLAQYDDYLVASPEYIANHGAPLHPDNLNHHQWIMQSANQLPRRCQFDNSDGEKFTLQLTPFINCNTSLGCLKLVKEGLGLAMLPEHIVKQPLQAEKLVRLLPDYHLGRGGIFAVHSYQDVVPARIKAMLAFMEQRLYRDTP